MLRFLPYYNAYIDNSILSFSFSFPLNFKNNKKIYILKEEEIHTKK